MARENMLEVIKSYTYARCCTLYYSMYLYINFHLNVSLVCQNGTCADCTTAADNCTVITACASNEYYDYSLTSWNCQRKFHVNSYKYLF